jgi:multidrug resistance protein, MATE family
MKLKIFSKVIEEIKKSLRLSLPLIASQLIYNVTGLVATIMVAQLGREALATNVLVWTIFVFLVLLFIGILNSISILVAQNFGAKNFAQLKIISGQGLILAAILSLPMMLLLFYAPYILQLTGQDQNIISLSIPFFHSLAWCVLPLNLLVAIEQILSGIGKTKLVVLISIFDVPLEIFLIYALIFGHFGFPKLGLAGIGWGFTIAMLVTDLVVGMYLYLSPKLKPYISLSWSISKKYLYEFLRVGFPIGGMFCIEVALFAAISLMMGKFGSDTLAAHQIAYQCMIFVLSFIFGLNQGTTVRIGHEVGANNREAIKLVAYVNIGIGFCYMILISVLYFAFPLKVIGLFINVHDLNLLAMVNLAKTFLLIGAIMQLFDCWRLVSSAILRGLKDTKVPMFISLICFWLITFPLAYLLGFVFKLQGAGIWLSLAINVFLAAVILQIRFITLIKKVDLQKMMV